MREVSRQAGAGLRRLALDRADYTAGVRQKSRFEACYAALGLLGLAVSVLAASRWAEDAVKAAIMACYAALGRYSNKLDRSAIAYTYTKAFTMATLHDVTQHYSLTIMPVMPTRTGEKCV